MQWQLDRELSYPAASVRLDGNILHWWQDTDHDYRQAELNEKQTTADFAEFGPLWKVPDPTLHALVEHFALEDSPWLDEVSGDTEELIRYVQKGDMVSLRYLVNQGVRVDGRDKNGYDAFYYAVRAGRRELALWLIEQGYPVNRYYHHHRTALMVAVEEREREIMATLLARGANPNAHDDWGVSVVARAARHEGTPLSIVQLLVEAGAGDIDGALVEAVYYNNRRIVDYLIRQGADINGRNADGWTPLEAAFRRGGDHPGMIRNLIGAGVDICQRFTDGRTLVHVSAERAWGKIMQVGLEAGLPVDDRDTALGFTPLMWAVQNGKNLTATKTLIALGADVNAIPTVSPTALTPLMLLAQEGDYWDMAETLMNAGANIHAVDAEGHTALVYAVKRNAKMVVKLLIEKGADPNVRIRRDNSEGAGYSDSSLLRLAADRRYTTIATALLKAGADPNAAEAYNFTALHQAVYDDNARLVALLLDYGANPRALEAETGREPLYYAKSDAVRQLLEGAVVA